MATAKLQSAHTVWKELKRLYGDDILLRCRADCRACPEQCKLQKNVWIFTTPSNGGAEKWYTLRNSPKNGKNDSLCENRRCNGNKCLKAHSTMEKKIWGLLDRNDLYLSSFVYQALLPEEQEKESNTPTTSRPKKKAVAQSWKGYNNAEYATKKFDKFFKKWRGRLLLVCKQCYCLQPKVLKEMKIGDGKVPNIYCSWCLHKTYLILHEGTAKNGNGVTFEEYNVVRQKSQQRTHDLCRHLESCPRKDECSMAHSSLELDFWNINGDDVLIDIIRHCNARADRTRKTLNGVFHCDICCISFPQAREYHRYMKQPHKHFKEIQRPYATWKYGPVPEQTESLELCKHKCPGKNKCAKAHSSVELEEWQKRLLIKKDISQESNVKVTVENACRDIKLTAKSVKWRLRIETLGQLKLLKVGFHRVSGFEVRTEHRREYNNVILIPEKDKSIHKFTILFINPKDLYGTRTGDLICEFTGPKLYRVRFEVNVSGDSIDVPNVPLVNENWAVNREIIRYHNAAATRIDLDEVVSAIESNYNWRPPRNAIDMRDISTENYAAKMHDLLYAEEQSRREVLSRLNIDCTIECGASFPNGNMLGEFFIPLSISTDEALLFKTSCMMVLIGKDDDIHAYECKIFTFDIAGEMDNQDKTKVTIDVPPGCCKDLELMPNSSFKTKVQFQLDRQMFCLRHYAVDNIGEKIKLLCPSKEHLASLEPISGVKMCNDLDKVQDMVYQYVNLGKLEDEESKMCPPVVVVGPFGTGKTHTIRRILVSLLRNGDNKPVLVCTHTNSAADLYFEDTIISSFGAGKVLRVTYHGRNLQSINRNVRRFCLFDERGTLRYPTLKELMQCRLVITTFTTALSLSLETGVKCGLFGHIFLDEASQAMEADVIMPLLMAECKSTRIVLAGDHKQTTEKMYSDKQCQVKTILERLYENEKDSGVKSVLLRNNYRCVKGILDLISKMFYKKNALKNKANVRCIGEMQAVYFIHVKGECVQTLHGDYANQQEAYQILQELRMLIKERQLVSVEDVVVVSAFRSQVRHVRAVLRKNGFGDVSVQPVQAIQGQEFRVVFLTTVMRRINCLKTPGENFGFLSDRRLLNVTMTRAKSLVVAVGDAVTLCSVGGCKQDWKTYLQYCEENHAICPNSVNVENVKQEITSAKKELRAAAAEFVPQAQAHFSMEDDDQESSQPSSDTDSDSHTHEYDDDDDTDSWCSEASVDDIILRDMVDDKTATELRKITKLSKVTIAMDRNRREFIQYDSFDEEEEDDDPNEIVEIPSRRRQKRTAIYPKFTKEQLEQMLARDKTRYRRCKINVKNWFSAEAVPIVDEEDERGGENEERAVESGNLEGNGSMSDNGDGDSDGEMYELNPGPVQAVAVPFTQISKVIYIETRLNLGRTFDQDEALVEIISRKRDLNNPNFIRRVGKVMGILETRPISPRNRYIMCRPNPVNPIFMKPYDRTLTLFAILAPDDNQPKIGRVAIYKLRSRGGHSTKDLVFQRYEEVDDTRVYVVRYLKWSECCMYPLGFVESSFDAGDFQKYLCLEYRVRTGHKKELVEEVENMQEPRFDDLTYIEVFTIDPEGCKDMDDALSFKIGIHITDVASVVREGSQIDLEAQRRRSTFYGLEKPAHMLPAELSNRRCSIVPGEIRQAVSTTFHTSRPMYANCKMHPRFEAVRPERTYVKSARKMSYAEAQKLYKAREMNLLHELDETDAKYAEIIHKLWAVMWRWRLGRLGAEAYYKRSDTFNYILETHAHLLIEEAMIATNMNTARYLTDWGFEVPIRAQHMPEERDWTVWEKVHANLIPNSCYLKSVKKHLRRRQNILEGLDEYEEEEEAEEEERESSDNEYEGGWQNVQRRRKKPVSKWMANKPKAPEGAIQSQDYVTIFENYWREMLEAKKEGFPDLFALIAACDDLHPSQIPSVMGFVRNQKKAYFTTRGEYHFSLRLEKYAWSTSPIRRYADILIQRCLVNLLENQSTNEETKEVIKRFCRVSDNRHRQFEQKLTEASLAKSFEEQPAVFEACIEQVSEAFVKVSIPLAEFVQNQKMQIKLGNLMIRTANGDGGEESNAATCMTLGWRLRYYKYSNNHDARPRTDSVAVVKIPTEPWKQFVQVLSSRPNLQGFQLDLYPFRLEEAIGSLTEAAERQLVNGDDWLTGETPNEPSPIKHWRRIVWKYDIGMTVLVQLSGSLDMSQLPTPDVQLFSIAHDLDVCVEHMKEPLKIFAKDVKRPWSGEIKSLKQYRNKWEPLVRMDGADNAVQETSSITIEGVMLSDAPVPKSKKGKRNRQHEKLTTQGIRKEYTAIVHGLVVQVEGPHLHAPQKYPTKEYREKPVRVHFKVLSGVIPPETQNGRLWTLELIPLSFAHRCMQKALYTISNADFDDALIRGICLGTVAQVPVPWSEEIKKKWFGRTLKRFPFVMNNEQKKQERIAIEHNFSLIQGPPGTGKSFLGAQIAAKFAYMNKDSGTSEKVLYAGPSNISVNVAAVYLLSAGDLKVVRMYSRTLEDKLYPNPLKPNQASAENEEDGKKPDPRLTNVALHELIRATGKTFAKEIKEYDARVTHGGSFKRSEMDHYNKLIRDAKMEELKHADIVICTCSCSCQLTEMMALTSDAGSSFAQCIIDECAMCSEPEAILPLVAVRPRQVVLIGDHMQLRPVIKCSRAERLGLGESLFMRYKDKVGMLTTQYRMHEQIMRFPSRQFYDRKLICDVSVRTRPRIRNDPFGSYHSRAIFWNVKGTEGVQHFKTTDNGDQSKFNNAQAKAVVQLLHRLRSCNMRLDSIRVLSPYTAQCKRIRDMLQYTGDLTNVHVGTVVTSQGLEADIVILSTVRALASSSIMRHPNLQWLRKHLGFLTDPNQVNVALTRAKQRLFIIGDKELLEVDTLWNELITAYANADAITDDLLQIRS